MKKSIFTILALTLLTFFSASNVSAQSEPPCGNIIYPVDFYYEGSDEDIDPIADCANPFNKQESLDGFSINNTPVTDGQIIITPEAGWNMYGFEGDSDRYGFRNATSYYLHSGGSFIAQDVNYLEPTRDEIIPLIEEFFNNQTDLIEKYTIIYFEEDNLAQYFQDENYEDIIDPVLNRKVIDVFFDITSFIRLNLIPKRHPLKYGTYTIVERINNGGGGSSAYFYPSTSSILATFLALIMPIANAQTPEGTKTVTFTLASENPEPVGASSVLFLPGIQASRLYKEGLLGTQDEIWVPDGNQDVRQLAMSTTGISQNEIYTKGIMADLPVGGTVYDSFARSMVNLVFDGVIKGWTPFAYDWRYSVNDIGQNGTKYENEIRDIVDEIEYLAENSFTKKVTIIGHSNGGLLAKVIMKRLEQEGKSNLVDTIIFLASPQLGTPKAVGTILHGYDQEKLGGWVIDDVVARDVIQNMPGAYGLVTSQKYFNNATDKVIRFENSTSTQIFRNAYGASIDSEEELKHFMIGSMDNRPQAQGIDEVLRANPILLNAELNLHGTVLDNWIAPSNVRVIEVIGTGLDTVSGFEYRSFRERVCSVLGTLSCETKEFYKPVPLISQKGDKTVMALSAEGHEGLKNKYYIDLNAVEDSGGNEEHYNISENPSIQKLISNILLATTSDIEFISTTTVSANSNRLLLGVHSPVTIEVLDLEGKRVGRKLVSGVPTKEEGILGSTYLEIGTSKYVIVPAEGNYTIKLKGTGEGGLTFSLDKLNGQTQIPQIFVNVATITASTSIGIKYTDNALSNIEIDTNGDTVIDTILTPLGVDITPKITYKTLRDKINTLSLSAIRKLPLLALVEVAEMLDKKSLINPKLTTAEVYTLNQLESFLVTYQQKGWITQSNLIELKLIINKLK